MIQWTQPAPPTEGVSFYDHVYAETPLGRILIEWKSWKDYDSYDCSLPWGKHVSENSLEYAQIRVEEEFALLRDSIMVTPIMRHKFRWKLQAACKDALASYDKEVIHWADFVAPDCGGSPMEEMEESLENAEADLFDAVIDTIQKEYGVTFG